MKAPMKAHIKKIQHTLLSVKRDPEENNLTHGPTIAQTVEKVLLKINKSERNYSQRIQKSDLEAIYFSFSFSFYKCFKAKLITCPF